MSRPMALLQLTINLLRGAALSGWQTARIILLRPTTVRPGMVRVHYGDLSEGGATLLAALVTLTPGTTAVAIDTERRELLLHLLDLDQEAATIDEIRRDLIAPIARLTGASR